MYLMNIIAQFDFFKVPRSCCTGHDCLPPFYIASAKVVSLFDVVWMVTIVTKEEWLDHGLVDHSRYNRYTRSIWFRSSFVHQQFCFLITPVMKKKKKKSGIQLV